MRNVRQRIVLYLALLTFAAGTVGCATTRAVKESVAKTNAAAISPYLEIPGSRGTDVWREPVAQIDQIILEHADQATLVNHLRVRQAMLLTVFQQANLARERWDQVDADDLTTERDRSLYNNRTALIWWYRRAPDNTPLHATTERPDAEQYIRTLTATLNDVQDADLRVYLGTIRAQMDYRLANDADVRTPALQEQVSEEIARDLERYVGLFTEQDRAWVRRNPTTDLSEGVMISDFRHRIWLREMIKNFRETSGALGLSPTWKPEWIAGLNFD